MKKISYILILLIFSTYAFAEKIPVLGISITPPPGFVQISNSVAEEVKSSAIEFVQDKYKNVIASLRQQELKNKKFVAWIGEDAEGNMVVIKALRTNKKLDTSKSNVLAFCTGFTEKIKNTFNIKIEYCKDERIGDFSAIHFGHKDLMSSNAFTDNYTFNISNEYVIAFSVTSNITSKEETLKLMSKMMNSIRY